MVIFIPSTDPEELKKFLGKLMDSAPKGYTPWLFPVQKNSKAPGVGKGVSWKESEGFLNQRQAIRRLEHNQGNVGISGRRDDRLILVDIDDSSIEDELKPTLKIRSRSRTGTHAIYWAHPEDEKLPCNIPTDKGEVRSSDQYVVAPGSYVPCRKTELEGKVEEGEITEKQKEMVMNDPKRGYYTLDNDKEITTIKFEELPKVFRKKIKKDEKKRKEIEELKKKRKTFEPKKSNNEHSALFDLDIKDVIPVYDFNKRNPHPLHNSDTGKNFSVSDKGVAHCWRHLVSLNAIQYLVVESGYMSCEEAGTGHNNSQGRRDAGPSYIIGDDGAIFHAWRQAKINGQIPKEDPVPVRGMHYIARKHDLYNPKEGEKLPWGVYNKVLKIIEEEY